MTPSKVLEVLTPKDLVIPRQVVPFACFLACLTLTMSALIGFIGGYMLTSDRHEIERAKVLADYTLHMQAKDRQIANMAERIIAMQEQMMDRDSRIDAMFDGVTQVIEEIAKAVATNKANATRLDAATRRLEKLKQDNRPGPAYPVRRPMIGPPPTPPVEAESPYKN